MEELEQKLKVFNLRDMPLEVQDIFIAEYFNASIGSKNSPAENLMGIFRGPQIEILIRGPVDSGHAQWRATPWYEKQGIYSKNDLFVIKIDIAYLIEFLKE